MSFYDGWLQTSFTHLREKWLGCHLCEGETSAVVMYCSGVMFSFVSLFVIRAKLSLLSPFVSLSPPTATGMLTRHSGFFFFFSFSWRCFKELRFQIWRIFICFDPIAPLDAQTTRLKIRMTRRDADAAHRRLTASYVVLNQHKSVGDGSRQSNLCHVVTHPAQTDEIICYRI